MVPDMRWRTVFLSLFLLVVVFSSITLVYGRSRIERISSFVVYYGDDRVEELRMFDLAILSPLLEEEIVELNNYGVITIGYVSLTTVGGWEPWAKNVSDDLVVGSYVEWGEKIVNACDCRWEKILLNQAIPYILGKGFKGVFLDNLDMVDNYPFMKNCVIKLVKDIRKKYPNVIIVVNRGFTIVEDIAPYVDAVLFEDFGTFYDFSKKQYLKWSGSDYVWMINVAEKLRKLSMKYGIIVLALGYADLNNKTMLNEYCEYVSNLASKYGFVSYVGNIYLNKVNTVYLSFIKNCDIEERESKQKVGYANNVYFLALATAIILTIIFIVIWLRKR